MLDLVEELDRVPSPACGGSSSLIILFADECNPVIFSP